MEEAVFEPFLKEEAMFRSIVNAVTKRFARGEKPVPEEPPPVSPGPEVNGNGTPEHVSIPDVSPIRAAMEIPAAKLNGSSTPMKVFIPDVSPGVPEDEIPSVELNGNAAPENGSVPDVSPSALEDEIRLRAYRKWEAAGKPKGSEHRFWREAKEELR